VVRTPRPTPADAIVTADRRWNCERVPVRVLTVDDQPLFRDAARAVIAATPGFEPIAELPRGEDALALLEQLHPDLVLVDVSLPGIDGLETSRRLTACDPAPLVVLISADDDPVVRESARDYGAAAFLSKQDLRPGALRTLWERFGAITPAG
jgi:two-component system, NarL family, invasion response regulator UvrY